ncbi:glycosyltransferase family 2 protein [Aerococcus viridans]|uniref:glycosyltransferase family 2 protein n=1 Tax=Aerococcus viridans TaxID=1377 RepID=UPI00223AAB5A|nr:glycosyltransferase family 2 protein [Aerococcus viridans]MCT1797322.1 glycosyltransferase [Aerococcus viridans]
MSEISIIIPMYNSEEFIFETINSLIMQTYKNIEILIIDDGSTDSSATIIEEKFNDKRIKYFYQENSGAPTARNYGLQKANGEYVLFFDSDDIMLKYGVEKLVNKIRKFEADLVVGDYNRIDSEGNLKSQVERRYTMDNYYGLNDQFSKIQFLANIDPLPGSKLFRKQFLLSKGITFEKLSIGQDLNFYLKCLGHCPKVEIIDDEIYSYRIRENSISRKYSKSILDIITGLEGVSEEHFKIYDKFPSILETLKFNHYSYHFYKIPFFDNVNDRRYIYTIFKKAFNRIQKKYINDEYVNVNIAKVRLALALPRLYTSQLLYYLSKNK